MKVWSVPVYVHVPADTAEEACEKFDAAGLQDGPCELRQGKRVYRAFYINVDMLDEEAYEHAYDLTEWDAKDFA